MTSGIAFAVQTSYLQLYCCIIYGKDTIVRRLRVCDKGSAVSASMQTKPPASGASPALLQCPTEQRTVL